MNERRLRAVLAANRLEWRKHVLERLAEREISQAAVLAVLDAGECIEDYPADLPYPSALYLGWDGKRPVHVVVALDEGNDWAYVITVYDPDLDHFKSDYRTRRQR